MAWYGELAPGILPHATPTLAGDKPLASRSLRPRYIGLGEVVADFSTDVLPRGIRAWIAASAGKTSAGFGGFRSHAQRRVKSFSYQSLMPACAGTPRYENSELRFYAATLHGGFCHAQARPQRGTSPRATFSHSAIDHRSAIRKVSPCYLLQICPSAFWSWVACRLAVWR